MHTFKIKCAIKFFGRIELAYLCIYLFINKLHININILYCDTILFEIRAIGGLQVWSLPLLTASHAVGLYILSPIQTQAQIAKKERTNEN